MSRAIKAVPKLSSNSEFYMPDVKFTTDHFAMTANLNLEAVCLATPAVDQTLRFSTSCDTLIRRPTCCCPDLTKTPFDTSTSVSSANIVQVEPVATEILCSRVQIEKALDILQSDDQQSGHIASNITSVAENSHQVELYAAELLPPVTVRHLEMPICSLILSKFIL
ncbi:hypothetical protein EB796_001836 [Bugula neritina]|uniref:Uncharacterized protein n=1 Tax=Bugula neritina TaxID=10212 RepID=A0A7J7KNY8_BUGNE|nr:hypothetical protein EB796_001836 [Bugula neritina]